jgi:hypothetical protein
VSLFNRALVPGLPDFYTHKAVRDPHPHRIAMVADDRPIEADWLLGCILDRLALGDRTAQALADEIGSTYSAIDYWLRIAAKRGLVERVPVTGPLSHKPAFRYRLVEK